MNAGEFFAFRPFRCFRPVYAVEPISAFYGQDGQEAPNHVNREIDIKSLLRHQLDN
jgi:hypothetical protein